MTEPNLQELAKQGNPEAIASLLNQNLQLQGITATANLEDGCLDVILEGDPVPDRFEFVDFVRSQLTVLEPESIQRVKVEGRKIGDTHSDWSQGFSLEVGSYSMLTFPEESSQNVDPPSNNSHLSASSPEVKAPEPKLENRLRSTFLVVGIVTSILAVAIVVFAGKMTGLIAVNTEIDKSEKPETKIDPFQAAVNKAMSASKSVLSAKTEADWNEVAFQWQEAIDAMKNVPASHPNHAIAQKKAAEYQKNLKYALESAKNSSQ